MTLNEINDEISKLRILQQEMLQEEREKHRKTARQFVGKCYRLNDGRVIKILDVPRTILYVNKTEYNEYKFPALFLQYASKPSDTGVPYDEYDFSPCYYGYIFFDLWRGNESKCSEDFKEISQDEFEAEFDKCIDYFKEEIKKCKQS